MLCTITADEIVMNDIFRWYHKQMFFLSCYPFVQIMKQYSNVQIKCLCGCSGRNKFHVGFKLNMWLKYSCSILYKKHTK